jgi:hypothetical protein
MPTARSLYVALAVAALTNLLAPAARANIIIAVDKSAQQMSVSVNGATLYQWSVSTGRAGYGTPSGTYHPQRLETTWFSKLYYNSPMPHSIFFHGGYAIHGSYEISRLGGPASHGCIRLHPSNAATLFALVKQENMGATTIVVSGENQTIANRRGPATQTEDNFFGRGFFTFGDDTRYAPTTVNPRQRRGVNDPFNQQY